MGAWGTGILQNDGAQDALVEVSSEIEAKLGSLGSPGEASGAQLLAMVGVLTQFSPYSFNVDNPQRGRLVDAIKLHRESMTGEGVEALLDAIVAGTEPDYEMFTFNDELAQALHGAEVTEFMMQKTWARAPEACFAHPIAAKFLQSVADECVAAVEDDFGSEIELVADLCREGVAVGHLALLLILAPIRVDPGCFERWLDTYERASSAREDDGEGEFFDAYDACMKSALRYGIKRFASA